MRGAERPARVLARAKRASPLAARSARRPQLASEASEPCSARQRGALLRAPTYARGRGAYSLTSVVAGSTSDARLAGR
jgi:hypothetical protein